MNPSRATKEGRERKLKAEKANEQKENVGERTQKRRPKGRPVAEIMEDEQSKVNVGKNNEEEESKKKPRWRDSAPPTIERPSRARKTIERFGSATEKESPRADKEIQVMKGSGTALKDIPNVAYKLGKVNLLKLNILSFSGYVWGENKEKEQKKVKDRLERFTREGLHQLIDILDIKIPKSSSKKDELVEEVYKFLLAPNKTWDTPLEEPEPEQEQKFKEVPLKGKERAGKRMKGNEKSTPKDKDAPKRQKQSEYAGDKRRSKSQKGTEGQKPYKRIKKSLDAEKEKENQQFVSDQKEMKDYAAADDEVLLEEEEPTEERTFSHAKNGGDGKEDHDTVESVVVTESLAIEKTDVEASGEGTGKDGAVDESGKKDHGVLADDIFQSMIEDEKEVDEGLMLVCEEEHSGRPLKEELKADERSFMATVKDNSEATEEEITEPLEQPEIDRELGGEIFGCLIPEYVEVNRKVPDPLLSGVRTNERICGEIPVESIDDGIEDVMGA